MRRAGTREVDPTRDAVITGIGVVHPLGIGHDAFWNALCRRQDTPPVQQFDAFDPTPWFGRNEARRLDPYLLYAVAAASLAHADAGTPELEADRTGVVMGNLYGAGTAMDAQRAVLENEGPDAVAPTLCAVACEDACASQIAIRLGCTGPSRLVVLSCASGTAAIGDAAALVTAGRCDAVFAGATLGPVPEVLRASYRNARVASSGIWERPFDRRRDGFVFTEGAAVVLVEAASTARARGAHPYARIAGASTTNDAFHLSKPSGAGLEAAMSGALGDAGLSPDEIAHVDAHATGTVTGDVVEAAAVRRVFGDRAPTISSIKGVTGHSLAACGAFEIAGVALAMHHGQLIHTAVDLDLDPEVALDVVSGAPRPWRPAPVLKNSFGLGGQNASLVLVPASTTV